MTATLGCVWLLMLLTSIEALGLRQDQRQHSFKRTDADISCRHRCHALQPLAVQVTARPTDLGSRCPTDLGERRARVFGAGGCGRIDIGAPNREAITEVAGPAGATLTPVVRSA